MDLKNLNNTQKESKEAKLLDTAFNLFTERGIKDTSIQDIVDTANVGKGTFYLYFKDKYQLRDVLIEKKSKKLFNDALEALRSNYISNFSDQIIFVINHIIDSLTKNTILLKFISKNLSWGVYSQTVQKIYQEEEKDNDGIVQVFKNGVAEHNIKLKNPDVILFMIIELVSSTCFTSILYNEPLPITEYKDYLYNVIRRLIESEN